MLRTMVGGVALGTETQERVYESRGEPRVQSLTAF